MWLVNWNTYGCVLVPVVGDMLLHSRKEMVRLPMHVASYSSLSKYSRRTIPSIVVLCKTNHRLFHLCRKSRRGTALWNL